MAEILRGIARTLVSWLRRRKQVIKGPRPGSDEQWTVWPSVRPGWMNNQHAQDEDEARGGHP